MRWESDASRSKIGIDAKLDRCLTRNGQPIAVCAETDLHSVLIDHSFHYREDPRARQREQRVFHSLWPHVRGIRSSGCLTYLAAVADGRLGGFVGHELGLWDIAGSSVILEEAGARLSDLHGQPLDLSWDDASWLRPRSAIGASAVIHQQMLSKILTAD